MTQPKTSNHELENTVKGASVSISVDSAPLLADCKRIRLNHGIFTIVDAKHFEWLNQWKWCVSKETATWYAVRRDKKGKTIRMHRLIMNTPIGMETDHKNWNGLDNRESNLRICTTGENQHNQKPQKGRASKYKGVSWLKKNKKWKSSIRVGGILLHLGCRNSEIECAKLYDNAAQELFGEFACTNF